MLENTTNNSRSRNAVGAKTLPQRWSHEALEAFGVSIGVHMKLALGTCWNPNLVHDRSPPGSFSVPDLNSHPSPHLMRCGGVVSGIAARDRHC